MTDLYLATVEAAVASPGTWVDIPRLFDSEANAMVTAACLEGGYLRVRPRDHDEPVIVDGKRYTRTSRPVCTRVERVTEGWLLRLRSSR